MNEIAKICPQCLNGTKTIFCHNGKPNVKDSESGHYVCMAWNEKFSQCKLIPNHYVLNTAGFENYK